MEDLKDIGHAKTFQRVLALAKLKRAAELPELTSRDPQVAQIEDWQPQRGQFSVPSAFEQIQPEVKWLKAWEASLQVAASSNVTYVSRPQVDRPPCIQSLVWTAVRQDTGALEAKDAPLKSAERMRARSRCWRESSRPSWPARIWKACPLLSLATTRSKGSFSSQRWMSELDSTPFSGGGPHGEGPSKRNALSCACDGLTWLSLQNRQVPLYLLTVNS